jgi:hypothetical protein
MDRIAAAVLLGDPTRDPSAPEPFQRGTSDPHGGILAGKRVPLAPELWPRTWAYCLSGDQVSASHRGRFGALWSGTHTNYEHNAEEVQDAAAAFVIDHLSPAPGSAQPFSTSPQHVCIGSGEAS